MIPRSLLLLLIPAASLFGQCPANPLTALSGTWTFNVQVSATLNFQPFRFSDFAAAGQFRAGVGMDRSGQPIGVLAITATSLIDQSTTRQEGDIGRFQIFADCKGGTLTMNLSSYPMQYDFWFTDGGRSLYLVSTNQDRPAIGSATQGVSGCPAGLSDPLSLLSGAYGFKIQRIPWLPFDGPGQTITTRSLGRAGRFVASVGTNRAGSPIGKLDLTATSNLPLLASVTRLEQDAGSFQIYPDCSGGTLTMNLSSRPQQYEFYFRAGFQEMDVISTSGVPSYGIVSQAGAAVCPANPLSLASGAWTFNIQALPQPDPQSLFATAGQWRASTVSDRAGNPLGSLAINATSLFTPDGFGYSSTRLENDLGRFQIFDDCSGGTLTMNLSSFPMQYDFFFYDNNRSMYIVSTMNQKGATGSAASGAPTSCPAGLANPLGVLSGDYTLKFQRIPGFTYDSFSLAGLMGASTGADRAGNPLGLLALTATSSIGFPSSITRQERDAGRFQVNDDCSGGTLTFNLSSRPSQYQFYFRSGFQGGDALMTTSGAIQYLGTPTPIYGLGYGSFTRY